jgi:hypothetical protein
MNEIQHMASLQDLQIWAKELMESRDPDFVIGDNYLRRWWVIPRNPFFNVYLHEINKSDDDRALHDHPWENQSFIIKGRYKEHTPEGYFIRTEGELISRRATALHRLEVFPGETGVISLFTTGPVVREWGFDCPNGWVHWRDFTNSDNPGRVGKGCGED